MRVGAEMNIELDIEAFANVLSQAIHWCASQVSIADPKQTLRSLPISKAESLIHMPHEQRLELVNELILKRKTSLLNSEVPLRPLASDLGGGKLMYFYPDGSLFDGAAEAASGGFFDCDNVPAWDTWVYYGSDSSGERENCDINLLVSWIPRELCRNVNDGIAVNPESCIDWAVNADRALTRSLKAHGLLR